MRGSICGVLALAASLALPALGQAAKSRISTVELSHPAHAAQLPYTAEYKTTTVKALAGGTAISHEYTEAEVRAMDSQGRLMDSTTPVSPSGNQVQVTHVIVADPVARTTSTWNVPGDRVTVTPMPAASPPRVKPVVENLGTETVNGIEAHGRRTRTTIPAGGIGNDAPLARTVELWTAIVPGLNGLLVREVNDDPRTGKTTRELTNLTRSEPDATVFQPPAGYEIVNREAGARPSASAVIAEPPPPQSAEAEPEPAAEPAPAPEQ